jgi:threonine/homoserine/homoserine lactone efflux protein
MRAALPFILVALALFAAACIIYIAWELSSGKGDDSSESED